MKDIEKFNNTAKLHADVINDLQQKIEEMFSFGAGEEYLKFFDCLEALSKGDLTDEKFREFALLKNAPEYWKKTMEVLQVAEHLKR